VPASGACLHSPPQCEWRDRTRKANENERDVTRAGSVQRDEGGWGLVTGSGHGDDSEEERRGESTEEILFHVVLLFGLLVSN